MSFSSKKAAMEEEQKPLLKEEDLEKSGISPQTKVEDPHVISYDARTLVSFGSLFRVSGTVWTNIRLWKMMGSLLLVSLCLGAVIFLLIPKPSSIDATKFLEIGSFLKVFLAFLLGFFMAGNVKRWMTMVKGFLGLFAAIRSLSLQLTALGVDIEKVQHVVRYSIVSTLSLASELEARSDPTPEVKQSRVDLLWVQLKQQRLLTEDEQKLLELIDDKAIIIWVWTASLLNRLAADGDIPPMASPTYGRIMSLCNDAQAGIRQIKASITIQIPFIYCHMLATLVHINSFMCSLTFGLTLGTALASILEHFNIHSPLIALLYPDAVHQVPKNSSLESAGQSIIMGMLTCLVAPFMYQAFLQIAMALAQPFDSEEAAVPLHKWIKNLRGDLDEINMLGANTPGWEKAQFKKPQ